MKRISVIITGAMAVLGTLAQGQMAVPQPESSPTPQVTAPVAEPSNKDVLQLLNGDVLHGSFLSIDPKTGVRWQHPAMKEPIQIDPASVARIKLERSNSNTNAPGENCRVQLSNGDELFGNLTAVDDQKLTLDTWYGGAISIPRNRIVSIAPGQAQSGVFFEGPTGIEGWTVKGNNTQLRALIQNGRAVLVPAGGDGNPWKFSNGGFVSSGNGSIGRAFDLPSMVNIEFDVAWRGYLLLSLSLFSDSVESLGASSYMLQLNQNNAYLQRMANAAGVMPFQSVNVPAFNQQQRRAHISLRVDKQKKSIWLVVNGEKIKEWTDTSDFPKGQNFVFHQQGQAFTKISGLKISAWDGKFEGEGVEQKSKEDSVKLVNGDKISGSLKSIQNGKMNFQSAFAALEVPLERIQNIEMAGEKTEKAPKQAGDVKLTFLDHGSILLHVEEWDGQQIVGSSPNYGQVKLKPSAFGELQFNLDQKRTEPEDEEAMGGMGSDMESQP